MRRIGGTPATTYLISLSDRDFWESLVVRHTNAHFDAWAQCQLV
jgi:hypothetical protein